MWYLAAYTATHPRTPVTSLRVPVRRPTPLPTTPVSTGEGQTTAYLFTNTHKIGLDDGRLTSRSCYDPSARSNTLCAEPCPSCRILGPGYFGMNKALWHIYELISSHIRSQDIKQNSSDCKDIIKLATDIQNLALESVAPALVGSLTSKAEFHTNQKHEQKVFELIVWESTRSISYSCHWSMCYSQGAWRHRRENRENRQEEALETNSQAK